MVRVGPAESVLVEELRKAEGAFVSALRWNRLKPGDGAESHDGVWPMTLAIFEAYG